MSTSQRLSLLIVAFVVVASGAFRFYRATGNDGEQTAVILGGVIAITILFVVITMVQKRK